MLNKDYNVQTKLVHTSLYIGQKKFWAWIIIRVLKGWRRRIHYGYSYMESKFWCSQQ